MVKTSIPMAPAGTPTEINWVLVTETGGVISPEEVRLIARAVTPERLDGTAGKDPAGSKYPATPR